MKIFDLLEGGGTEMGAISLFIFLIIFLNKLGIFKKMKIWIKIGGNGGSTGIHKKPIPLNNPHSHPGLETAIESLEKAHDKSCKNNREDHGKIFDKIEAVWKALGKK